jgi:hypothetical protein
VATLPIASPLVKNVSFSTQAADGPSNAFFLCWRKKAEKLRGFYESRICFPGINVMIFTINFRRKKLHKIGVFDSKHCYVNYEKNWIITKKNANYSPKIGSNRRKL